LKSSAFYSSIVKFNLHFRGIYCFHFQGQRASQASNEQDIGLLSLLFDPEDGERIFLRNVGEPVLDYMA
jgi:hypothetical protein